jgi:hypothetical protein
MAIDWDVVLWSDAIWAAGMVVVLVAFIGLIFWLGARIAVVIAGGLLLLGVYLLGRAVSGG